jgi:hypothetical protein
MRLRTRKTKGAGSRATGLTMAFNLLEAANTTLGLRQRASQSRGCRAGATVVDG